MTADRCVNAKFRTTSITYPPEMLPRSDDGDADVIVIDPTTGDRCLVLPTTKTPRGIRKTGGGGCSE